jgi:hypothetical protein
MTYQLEYQPKPPDEDPDPLMEFLLWGGIGLGVAVWAVWMFCFLLAVVWKMAGLP